MWVNVGAMKLRRSFALLFGASVLCASASSVAQPRLPVPNVTAAPAPRPVAPPTARGGYAFAPAQLHAHAYVAPAPAAEALVHVVMRAYGDVVRAKGQPAQPLTLRWTERGIALDHFRFTDVNPGFPARGRTMNCALTAVANDLRKRTGMAIVAPPKDDPTPTTLLENMYGRRFVPTNLAALTKLLSMAGPGVRGIMFGTNGGIGHFFNVEVDALGRVVFEDPQSGKHLTGFEFRELQFLETSL
jgi:hypothetical protein